MNTNTEATKTYVQEAASAGPKAAPVVPLPEIDRVLPDGAQTAEKQNNTKKPAHKSKFSGKKMGLKQLAQKTYSSVPNLPEEFTRSFGDIEDSFD